jgi:hypothetical protein
MKCAKHKFHLTTEAHYVFLCLHRYKVLELHQDVVLKDKRTLYWCKFHKVPELGKKHHIVGVSSLTVEWLRVSGVTVG